MGHSSYGVPLYLLIPYSHVQSLVCAYYYMCLLHMSDNILLIVHFNLKHYPDNNLINYLHIYLQVTIHKYSQHCRGSPSSSQITLLGTQEIHKGRFLLIS